MKIVIFVLILAYGANRINEANEHIINSTQKTTHFNYSEPEPEPTYYFHGYDIREDPNYDSSEDLLYNKRMLEGFEKWKKEQHGY